MDVYACVHVSVHERVCVRVCVFLMQRNLGEMECCRTTEHENETRKSARPNMQVFPGKFVKQSARNVTLSNLNVKS